MKRILMLTAFIATFTTMCVILCMGCAGYDGEIESNQQPSVTVWPDADSLIVAAAPVVYFRGFDRDGEVYYFDIINIARGDIPDSDYYDYFEDPTTIPDEVHGTHAIYSWRRKDSNRDTLFLSLLPRADTTEHLVCVRGLDSDSMFSDPVCRIWYRTNRPPDSLYVLNEWLRNEELDTVWCLQGRAYS